MKVENKRKLKREGCKNVALVDIQYHYEDGTPYIRTYFVPWDKTREFRYESEPHPDTGEISVMENCYLDIEGDGKFKIGTTFRK